jgi:hypothetical protein
MFFSAMLVAQLAQERIEREIATAELLRRGRLPSPSFRQAVGRRVIRFGARLAAEPSLESARPR